MKAGFLGHRQPSSPPKPDFFLKASLGPKNSRSVDESFRISKALVEPRIIHREGVYIWEDVEEERDK